MRTDIIKPALLFLALLGGVFAADKEAGADWPARRALDLGGGVSLELLLIRSADTNLPPFYAGKYEVTQAQWQAVMDDNPSEFKGARRPVEEVTWEEATNYCARATARLRAAGRLPAGFVITLPTEPQWEALTANAAEQDAVCSVEERRSATADVGSRGANQFGLHDTRGNVWEWCLNPYDPEGRYRVARGGAWGVSGATVMATAFRYATFPDTGCNCIGFRCVLVKEVDPPGPR